MKYIIFSFFIILLFFTKNFGNALDIKLLSLTYENSDIFDKDFMEKNFGIYASNHNLNISISLDVLKYEKPTDSYSFFKSLVESMLKKSNNPYDIYVYNSRYTDIYGPYLLNLSLNLPKEHIKMYDSDILRDECIYTENNELIGLPVCLTYEVLYSNKQLLSKYNKPIPKTWDELIETCKYIMERENDSELICYNGLFDDSEQGLYSLYEFIYSCRDSYNSTYPNIQDQSFINSLKMLKKLKNEVDKEFDIFNSNENFTFMKLLNGKAIFLKYWLLSEPLLSNINYYPSIIPGLKEGISGSMILAFNMGITNNITEERKKAAIEVIKFFTSKEYQRNLFKDKMALTALRELLEDEELCKNELCDLIKRMQITGEPDFIKNGPENYEKKYQKYIYQLLYDDKTIEEVLK